MTTLNIPKGTTWAAQWPILEMGATAGELHMQARSEVANSAITLRKGSPLRVM